MGNQLVMQATVVEGGQIHGVRGEGENDEERERGKERERKRERARWKETATQSAYNLPDHVGCLVGREPLKIREGWAKRTVRPFANPYPEQLIRLRTRTFKNRGSLTFPVT